MGLLGLEEIDHKETIEWTFNRSFPLTHRGAAANSVLAEFGDKRKDIGLNPGVDTLGFVSGEASPVKESLTP